MKFEKYVSEFYRKSTFHEKLIVNKTLTFNFKNIRIQEKSKKQRKKKVKNVRRIRLIKGCFNNKFKEKAIDSGEKSICLIYNVNDQNSPCTLR